MLLLRESKKFYGPNGPFEDWSFLNILCSKFSNLDALQWVMATMLYERRHRRRSCNLTCDDLKKKSSPVLIYHLRHELIQGLLLEYITPAMKIAATATNDPSMVEAKVALEKFCAGYQSVAVYYERLDAKDTQWKAGLPKWCAVRLQKIFRQVMSGVRDGMLGNFLKHLPKKGWESITWKEHLKNASSWGDELEELEREFAAWKSPPKDPAGNMTGGQSPAETKEDPSLPPDEASPVAQLVAELGAMAKEQREHWVANVPEPGTVFFRWTEPTFWGSGPDNGCFKTCEEARSQKPAALSVAVDFNR